MRTASTSASAIAARLRHAIMEGAYAYGERLPSERQVAQELDAARGTVRSALSQLEAARLVNRRVGSGTFVRYRGHADREGIAALTSPLELIEVRLSVEPPIARLAVMHSNAEDLERMSEALDRVRGCDGDAEAFSRADEMFHLAIAESTRNPLMVWLYRHINDVRGHPQWDAGKDKVLTPERIVAYNVHHQALFEAIESRDVEVAVSTITGHLEKARSDLLGVSREALP